MCGYVRLRAGFLSALLLFGSTVFAGVDHHSGAVLSIPDKISPTLARAIQAQHDHDFATSRELLGEYLENNPGDPQALLVLSAVEAATGHWDRVRRACAPLSTQMPGWVVAACLGQSATGENEVRATLKLLSQRPRDDSDAMAVWADEIAHELHHRVGRHAWQPAAAHPE